MRRAPSHRTEHRHHATPSTAAAAAAALRTRLRPAARCIEELARSPPPEAATAPSSVLVASSSVSLRDALTSRLELSEGVQLAAPATAADEMPPHLTSWAQPPFAYRGGVMCAAAAELLLLRRCAAIVVTPHSSFSQMALALAGSPPVYVWSPAEGVPACERLDALLWRHPLYAPWRQYLNVSGHLPRECADRIGADDERAARLLGRERLRGWP